jgi:predicted dehydrogenase
MGMVGGGPGAFIGEVHRKASRLDGQVDLVAGAFDIDPKKSRKQGAALHLDKRRVYSDYKTMIAKELALPADQRIDFVAVTTPNNWHFPIARDFLQAGFHVMCEKPMTLTVAEALELRKIARASGKVFGLMHNYTGYPMVKLARDMVEQGDLGRIYKVVVHYQQGWLARPIERQGQMQASWRTDPKQSGAAGCMGDIGTHAANLAEYITGQKITEICADLTTFVKGRRLDDDGNCLIRFRGGAKGVLFASQVSIGEENNLAIWVYGENRSLEWHQEEPNHLIVNELDQARQVWRRGNGYIGAKSAAAARNSRLPCGHPEAFFEAFANNYMNFVDTVRAKLERRKASALEKDFPGVEEGVRGMQFIAAVVKSSQLGAKWVKLAP